MAESQNKPSQTSYCPCFTLVLVLILFTLDSLVLSATTTASSTTTPAPARSPCAVQPFIIELRNCTPSSYGVVVQLGNPPQLVCLAISMVVSSTLIQMASLCSISDARMSEKQCEAIRGGFFKPTLSTSFAGATDEQFNQYIMKTPEPAWEIFNNDSITRVGYDALRIPGSSGGGATARPEVYFKPYPLALNERGNQSNEGMLGLSSNSVLLNISLAENAIPYRGFGLDSGRQFTNPRNGELVLGGRNRARMDGVVDVWNPISDLVGEDRPCALRTKIASTKITMRNGTELSLKSSPAEMVTACIEPYDNLFRFTGDMLDRFKEYTQYNPDVASILNGSRTKDGLAFTEEGLLYDANATSIFSSMTITLENGYSTTIEHEDLVQPFRGWNSAGERVIVPNIYSIAVFNKATEEKQIPTLGNIFLSSTYLIVDYPKWQYGLVRSRAEAAGPDIVSFVEACPPTTTGGTPVGTIVGGAIGGVAVIALACVLIYFIHKAYSRRTDSEVVPSMAEPPLPVTGRAGTTGPGGTEMPEMPEMLPQLPGDPSTPGPARRLTADTVVTGNSGYDTISPTSSSPNPQRVSLMAGRPVLGTQPPPADSGTPGTPPQPPAERITPDPRTRRSTADTVVTENSGHQFHTTTSPPTDPQIGSSMAFRPVPDTRQDGVPPRADSGIPGTSPQLPGDSITPDPRTMRSTADTGVTGNSGYQSHTTSPTSPSTDPQIGPSIAEQSLADTGQTAMPSPPDRETPGMPLQIHGDLSQVQEHGSQRLLQPEPKSPSNALSL